MVEECSQGPPVGVGLQKSNKPGPVSSPHFAENSVDRGTKASSGESQNLGDGLLLPQSQPVSPWEQLAGRA